MKTISLIRRKVKRGHYALYQGDRRRAEIVWLPEARRIDSLDHWLVYLDGDPEHDDGCKARTLREAETNARHQLVFRDAHPADLRSDQERARKKPRPRLWHVFHVNCDCASYWWARQRLVASGRWMRCQYCRKPLGDMETVYYGATRTVRPGDAIETLRKHPPATLDKLLA